MRRFLTGLVFFVILIGGFILLSRSAPLQILTPQGPVAGEEYHLITTAIGLMLIVVIPVFILLFFFAWRYRAGNEKAVYLPNWEHSRLDECIWWAVPTLIVAALAVLTWQSTHALDPYRPLSATTTPLSVDVVALDWKWLFIYPAQGIASVNYLEIPAGTPINLYLTADAPMNSFWVPELSGQIYAMPGMSTELHIEASGAGAYGGMSANFSGDGFSGMQFLVHSVPEGEFNTWVAGVRYASSTLSWNIYETLAKPSENNPVQTFSAVSPALYTQIIDTYMTPSSTSM
ncbi:MAG: ubiquinol oxidase subunit II [Patescibacteria group bacterium]|nr:ubiquinol oxidase subunit II [Patescibacteria group bacterium]